jgi:hypothetical protein
MHQSDVCKHEAAGGWDGRVSRSSGSQRRFDMFSDRPRVERMRKGMRLLPGSGVMNSSTAFDFTARPISESLTYYDTAGRFGNRPQDLAGGHKCDKPKGASVPAAPPGLQNDPNGSSAKTLPAPRGPRKCQNFHHALDARGKKVGRMAMLARLDRLRAQPISEALDQAVFFFKGGITMKTLLAVR